MIHISKTGIYQLFLIQTESASDFLIQVIENTAQIIYMAFWILSRSVVPKCNVQCKRIIQKYNFLKAFIQFHQTSAGFFILRFQPKYYACIHHIEYTDRSDPERACLLSFSVLQNLFCSFSVFFHCHPPPADSLYQ